MRLGAMDNIVAAGDDRATFARAARLGLAGVEVNILRAQLREAGTPRLAHLKTARDTSGLTIPSLVLPEHNRGGVGSPDEAVAAPAREDIRQVLGWAAELDAQVLLVPFFAGGDLIGEEALARAAAALRELAAEAQQRGVTLCYEGTLPAAAIRKLAEQVGSPAFGCYFDLANVVGRGMDTATEIRALGPLIRQVHMKETRVGSSDLHPGLGQVDYASSAEALREIGYNGWLVLETPPAPDPLVARDISFTRRIFPEINWLAPWPRFGAFSYGFGKGELPRLIQSFRSAGLGAVQLGSELLDAALEQPADTLADLTAGGIAIAGLAGYRNLVARDETQRRANIQFIRRCLEIAPALGTTVVATETGTRHPTSDWSHTPENWERASWNTLCAAIEELLPVAEQHGSILALEGYVNNVLITQGQLRGLLEQFPSPHLQVVCDPYNYLSSHLLPAAERVSADFLARFEPRFVLAHLKDVAATGAEADTPAFGTGVFPQRMYLQFLRDQRPDLALILEHLPFEQIPATIERVRAAYGAGDAQAMRDDA